jgi:hypothetical protein
VILKSERFKMLAYYKQMEGACEAAALEVGAGAGAAGAARAALLRRLGAWYEQQQQVAGAEFARARLPSLQADSS